MAQSEDAKQAFGGGVWWDPSAQAHAVPKPPNPKPVYQGVGGVFRDELTPLRN